MTANEIVDKLCELTEHDREAVLSPTRGQPEDVVLRWVAMKVYRDATQPARTLSAVGRAFDRDRTTVRHGLQALTRRLETDALSPETVRLRKLIKSLQKAVAEHVPI